MVYIVIGLFILSLLILGTMEIYIIDKEPRIHVRRTFEGD